MKANCLNWAKVVEAVGDTISIEDVKVIQKCTNVNLVTKYKDLVDFLFDKANPIQIYRIKYLNYWSDFKRAQIKSVGKATVRTLEKLDNSVAGAIAKNILSRIIAFIFVMFIFWLISLIF